MKTECIYICEICGQKFRSEEAAIKCENNHYEIENIAGVNYDKDSTIPEEIKVKVKNKLGEEKIITMYR